MSGERPKGDSERTRASVRFASERGGVLVLKGHRTIVATGEEFSINLSGNPGLATGGSGDVLSGVIGALLAQSLAPFDAATLGAWVHGRAGDIAATKIGEASIVASDVIDPLGPALRERTTP
ncbi:MAG: ADP/ATP-dependent (S)-NAD(P)H-hydrate dehydratase [Planctomycetota bacterium]